MIFIVHFLHNVHVPYNLLSQSTHVFLNFKLITGSGSWSDVVYYRTHVYLYTW